MRKDLDRVLIERPRWSPGRKVTKKCKRSFYNQFTNEDFPKLVPMRLPYLRKYNEKELSDFLTPLRGFIEKAAKEGKHVNDVLKELKSVLSDSGTSGQHVLGHVYESLEFTNSSGQYYYYGQKGKARAPDPESTAKYGDTVRVELDGRLRFIRKEYRKPRRERKLPEQIAGRRVIKLEGVWYWLEEERLDIQLGSRDNKTYFGLQERNWRKKDYSTPTNVRRKLTQISKKDIAKYKLP